MQSNSKKRPVSSQADLTQLVESLRLRLQRIQASGGTGEELVAEIEEAANKARHWPAWRKS